MLRTRKTITAMLVFSFLCLSGCGQKGDLYLPGQKDASLNQQHPQQQSYQIS